MLEFKKNYCNVLFIDHLFISLSPVYKLLINMPNFVEQYIFFKYRVWDQFKFIIY